MSVRAPVGPINFATQKICIGRGLAAIRAGKSVDSIQNKYLSYEDAKAILGDTENIRQLFIGFQRNLYL